MKATFPPLVVCMATCMFYTPLALADTALFTNGQKVSGAVVETNGDEILLVAPYGAYSYSRAHIKEIRTTPEQVTPTTNTNRLSDFKRAIVLLSKQVWATNLAAIPATVIDKGILRNVPYTSFQCGENYEVNIYGDLDHPAGIEVGFYKTLPDNELRQTNCVMFLKELLPQSADKEILQTLNSMKDLRTLDGLTFEITPPSADDSYNGWWLSVYSEKQLDAARASEAEMSHITVTKLDAARQSNDGDPSQWSAQELNLARSSVPITMTITNKYGDVISDAAVRIYEKGVSIIWERGNSEAGVIMLADLPETVRNRFGYDPVKAHAVETAKKEKEKRWRQANASQAVQQSQQAAAAQSLDATTYQSSGTYSGGTVYVHGYTRSNGTYVNAYTRSSPRSR
jgi:hypothetical protein